MEKPFHEGEAFTLWRSHYLVEKPFPYGEAFHLDIEPNGGPLRRVRIEPVALRCFPVTFRVQGLTFRAARNELSDCGWIKDRFCSAGGVLRKQTAGQTMPSRLPISGTQPCRRV